MKLDAEQKILRYLCRKSHKLNRVHESMLSKEIFWAFMENFRNLDSADGVINQKILELIRKRL